MQAAPTVTSPSHPAVKAARKLARADGRRLGDDLIVEGPQAVRESLHLLERLFVTDGAATAWSELVDRAIGHGVEVVPVSPAILASITQTVSPQGIVGVGRLEDPGLTAALDSATLVVVLHEVRDPGNAGTVIRTADAAGADAVVLAGECVNPRNGKAVRASAGSLFHLPVARARDWSEAVVALRAAGLAIVGTDAAAPLRHTEADLAAPTALVFGNEAHGLGDEVAADCDALVSVPILGGAESLNLAATVAVVTYEAARQRQEPR